MLQIYNSALAQYSRARHLLSLSVDVPPGNLRETSAFVGSPSASRGEDLDEDHSAQVEVSQDVQEKPGTASTEKREQGRLGGKEEEEREEEEEEKFHNAAITGVSGVARITHSSRPLNTAASEATSAEPVPGHKTERAKSEDSRSEGQTVFGFASVEVGVSVRNSLILRNEAADEDLGSGEGDHPSIQPVKKAS